MGSVPSGKHCPAASSASRSANCARRSAGATAHCGGSLARLVELEYVLVYRTGRGNQRVCQLVYDGPTADGEAPLLGLTDIEELRGEQPQRQAGVLLPRSGPNRRFAIRTGTESAPESAANRRPGQTTLNDV